MKSGPRTVVVLPIAVVGAMVGASVLAGGREGREALECALADYATRVEARQAFREAVWGETTEGRAFDRYTDAEAALRHAVPFWPDRATGAFRDQAGAITAEQLAERRARLAAGIASVSAGARSCDRTRPTPPIGISPAQLVNPLKSEIWARVAEGHAVAAVELWLDGATMASDCRDWFTFRWSLLPVWDDAGLRDLPTAALGRLADGLARLDEEMGIGAEFAWQLAAAIRSTLAGRDASRPHDTAIDASLRSRVAAWRTGFDPVTLHLERLDELREIGALLEPPAADEAGRRAQWRAFRTARRRTDSDVANSCYAWIRHLEEQRVDCLDELRRLRRGAEFLRGLPDPPSPR